MNKIAFIGAGNMNRAIIAGLINNGVEAKQYHRIEPFSAKTRSSCQRYMALIKPQVIAKPLSMPISLYLVLSHT